MQTVNLEKPIEYELKDYKEPLLVPFDKNGAYITHEALVSHSAYTLARMWEDGFKWNENFWCEIFETTEKALLVSVCAKLYWVPKRLIKKVRKMREVVKNEEAQKV